MAYNKTVWKDRVVSRPRTYIETSNADGSITHTPSEGTISEAGTPVNAINLNKIETELMEKSTRLDTESLAAVTLAAGKQILNATKNARLQGLKVQGRTLIDLLGGAGSGESLTGWALSGAATTLSTSVKRSGSSSFKFMATNSSACIVTRDIATPLDPTKQYILCAWVFIESTDVTGNVHVGSLRDVGTSTSRYSLLGDTTKVGVWQFAFVKIPTSNSLIGNGFRLYAGYSSANNMVLYVDDIRLYAVSAADYATIGTSITGEAIDRLLPYVPPGINGVDGLWVRRYGKNLLPSVPNTLHANAKMNGPYDITLTGTADYQISYLPMTPALPNTPYVFSCNATGYVSTTVRPYTNIRWFDTNGTYLSGQNFLWAANGALTQLATSPANAAFYQIGFQNQGVGTYRYTNWQLELGNTATPFTPCEDSLIAFGGVELHANPTDGSEPDILREVNGRYEVTRLWREILLNGSLPWVFQDSFTGFKRVSILRTYFGDLPANSAQMAGVKYNGLPLISNYNVPTAADVVGSGPSYLNVSISSADSGWGDSYTPSTDEIKAYFNGWRMYNGASGVATNPYNGTAGQTKGWVEIWSAGNPVGVLPTTIPPGWTPYQLLYRLATPTAETVQEDGSLSLLEGDNFIEVGSGYVSRERVNIAQGVGWYINHKPLPASKLKYLLDRFIGIFKNGSNDTDNWKTNSTGNNATMYAYGNYYAETSGPIDPAASYSVSYIKLDKSPVPSVVGSYAATEKGQLRDLTDGVTEALARVSVVEAKKTEKDASTVIYPTLLNSWVSNSGEPVSYRKFNNMVFITGRISGGAAGIGVLLFKLPSGFRPASSLTCATAINAGGSLVLGEIVIAVDGSVLLYVSGNTYVDLASIPPFLVD